jgi:hypothetical protein
MSIAYRPLSNDRSSVDRKLDAGFPEWVYRFILFLVHRGVEGTFLASGSSSSNSTITDSCVSVEL